MGRYPACRGRPSGVARALARPVGRARRPARARRSAASAGGGPISEDERLWRLIFKFYQLGQLLRRRVLLTSPTRTRGRVRPPGPPTGGQERAAAVGPLSIVFTAMSRTKLTTEGSKKAKKDKDAPQVRAK